MAARRQPAAGPPAGWRERLRELDERVMWTPATARPRLGPGSALALGLVAVCVYVGWALVWGWPRALLTVLVVTAGLVAAARFWFAEADPQRPAERRAQPPYADAEQVVARPRR